MMDKNNVIVKGHKGTWYVVEEVTFNNETFYLLEHNTHGEDAPWVAVNVSGELVMEDITDGAEELLNYLEEGGSEPPDFNEDLDILKRIEASMVNPYPYEDYEDDILHDYDVDDDEEEEEEEA